MRKLGQKSGNLPEILTLLFMKHCYILLFFLLIFSHSTIQAQTATRVATSSLTRADTIRAVNNMFRRHRIGGIVWTAIGAAFTVQVAGASAAGSGGNASGTVVGIAVFGGIPAGIGISKMVRFGAARQAEALHAYDESRPLPHYIQRRLKKAKYFR